MHNLDTSEPADNWYNYNGELISGIDNIIQQFFASLLDRNDNLPTYSTLIAHISTKNGGLGIINASLRAAPQTSRYTRFCHKQRPTAHKTPPINTRPL